MNLCVPHYIVPPTSTHSHLEALKKHVTVHKYISTAVFYLGDKIYSNEYTTVVNDMCWIPCLGEIYNSFCFYYVGSLIMNHKYIENEDAGGVNVYFDRGKASSQCQKRRKDFLGCLF